MSVDTSQVQAALDHVIARANEHADLVPVQAELEIDREALIRSSVEAAEWMMHKLVFTRLPGFLDAPLTEMQADLAVAFGLGYTVAQQEARS